MEDADEKLPHVPQAAMLQPNMFGCSQVMGSQSDYMVPSQQATALESTQDADMSCAINSIADSDLDITETGDCFNDFKQMYGQIAKLAQAHGMDGREVLKSGLHQTRMNLYALDNPQLNPTGMNSAAAHIIHRRAHKRKKKAGSPDRTLRSSKRNDI